MLLFCPPILLSSNSFFLPIMLNIYSSPTNLLVSCRVTAYVIAIFSFVTQWHVRLGKLAGHNLVYWLLNYVDYLTVLLEYLDQWQSIANNCEDLGLPGPPLQFHCCQDWIKSELNPLQFCFYYASILFIASLFLIFQ